MSGPTLNRPAIVVTVGNYLPGHKAGGIVRTIANTVDHLSESFDFKIITRDRDLGDTAAYPNVRLNSWQPVSGAEVWYLPPEDCTLANVGRLLRATPHAALYLNSFFDPLTVYALVNIKLRRAPATRVVVAPRGEFAWASFSQKVVKKVVFIWLARLAGLYRDVIYHASSDLERDDIMLRMKAPAESIQVAFDFPMKAPAPAPGEAPSEDGRLRLVYLSRVAREKNLDVALRVLARVRARVVFDIYGPTADEAYWNTCRELIAALPPNIEAKYCGAVDANDVMRVFSRYDAFLFPTGGEAFGHAMAESLLAGTPLITSTLTPWRQLEADGLGWDIDLADEAGFVAAIEAFAAVPAAERWRRRAAVREGVQRRLSDPAIPESHRRLFVA